MSNELTCLFLGVTDMPTWFVVSDVGNGAECSSSIVLVAFPGEPASDYRHTFLKHTGLLVVRRRAGVSFCGPCVL